MKKKHVSIISSLFVLALLISSAVLVSGFAITGKVVEISPAEMEVISESNVRECSNLWWFDEDNIICSQKQFCGTYMYYGLQTFESEAACKAALTTLRCTDSDNGKNIYVKGTTATLNTATGVKSSYTDYCRKDKIEITDPAHQWYNYLTEFTCDELGGISPDDSIICQNGCKDGACIANAHCSNRLKDGDESGIDCGGSCPSACVANNNCNNGIKDGDETGVDCGGSCPAACKSDSCVTLGGAGPNPSVGPNDVNKDKKCCRGLVLKAPLRAYRGDTCEMATGAGTVCIACGDGKCDSAYENKCNCPEDCDSNVKIETGNYRYVKATGPASDYLTFDFTNAGTEKIDLTKIKTYLEANGNVWGWLVNIDDYQAPAYLKPGDTIKINMRGSANAVLLSDSICSSEYVTIGFYPSSIKGSVVADSDYYFIGRVSVSCYDNIGCYDNDGGNRFYYKGSVTSNAEVNQVATDICNDDYLLYEYICNEIGAYLNKINCPYGCKDGACISNAHCSNRLKDGDESGIDCGGSCPAACKSEVPEVPNEVVETVDCAEGYEPQSYIGEDGRKHGRCVLEHCVNGIKDADETGIDCGGSSCRACEIEKVACEKKGGYCVVGDQLCSLGYAKSEALGCPAIAPSTKPSAGEKAYCCLPSTAGAAPACEKIGTEDEGWYVDGKLVKLEKCFCSAVCKNEGTRSEGWYNSCNNALITFSECTLKVPLLAEKDDSIEVRMGEKQVVLSRNPSGKEVRIKSVDTATTTETLRVTEHKIEMVTGEDVSEIKHLPEDARKAASAVHKLKQIDGIELTDDNGTPVYVIHGIEGYKILWLIPASRNIIVKVDAATNEVIN